jgi:hypothetical protein
VRGWGGLGLALAAVAAPTAAWAGESAPDHYVIESRYETETEGDSGSGSSSGRNTYTEFVRDEAGGCVLRSFDVVDDSKRPRPLAIWQFPLVLRECPGAAPVLANREAMLGRRNAFLAAMGVGEEACGKHYFTWNVFQIECDPDEAVLWLAQIDLAAIRLEDGAEHVLADTGTRVTLQQVSDASPGARAFSGSGVVDPAFLRDKAVETIMVVAEVSGETITREEAVEQVAARQFSGETAITLVEEPAAGRITATITGQSREVDAMGKVETRRGKVVITRKRVGAASSPDPSKSLSE